MMLFYRCFQSFLKNYIRNSRNMLLYSDMVIELSDDVCGLSFNAIDRPVQNLIAYFECISFSGRPTWPVIKYGVIFVIKFNNS